MSNPSSSVTSKSSSFLRLLIGDILTQHYFDIKKRSKEITLTSTDELRWTLRTQNTSETQFSLLLFGIQSQAQFALITTKGFSPDSTGAMFYGSLRRILKTQSQHSFQWTGVYLFLATSYIHIRIAGHVCVCVVQAALLRLRKHYS
ncbi:hypothetical protein TNCV_1531071 [Trichonephila clavipes]|nr:hypothetical protein TNCV_1531071 [Trichonephila clavipes]